MVTTSSRSIRTNRFHVRLFPNGRVSKWIHDDLRVGHAVKIRGPQGDCFYVPGNPDHGIVLIGTGTGLAPLYGIVRDTLRQGRQGPIRLFHGSREKSCLYLADELKDLTRQYPNFDYVPCLSGQEVPSDFRAGRAHEIALGEFQNLKNWRVYLCGHPEMVKATRKRAFLAGASLNDIYADAFHLGA